MEITLRLNLRADANPVAVAQFLEWVRQIDAGPTVTEKVTLGDASREVTGPADHVARETHAVGDAPTWTAPAEDGLTNAEAAATAAEQTPTGAAKPGRRKRGAADAAAQAEALAGATGGESAEIAARPAEPPAQAQPAGTPPPGFAIPPGATPPSQQQPASVAQPPQQPEPEAAMPKPTAAPPAAANGSMMLEDFKSEANDIHTAAQAKQISDAYPFNVIRKDVWPDGSAKPWRTVNLDSVPPEARRRVLDECMNVLMKVQ